MLFLRYREDTRSDRLNGYTWIIQVWSWYAGAMVGGLSAEKGGGLLSIVLSWMVHRTDEQNRMAG